MTMTDTQVAAALCEQVYRRDPADQQLTDSDISTAAGGGSITDFVGEIPGFVFVQGYYYNNDTGFVGRIVNANGKIFVVFRGSDISTGAIASAFMSDPPPGGEESYIDQQDWSDNRKLGLTGTLERTQLDDALALVQYAKAHAPAGASIVVTGHSLGAGLAGLATAIENSRGDGPAVQGYAFAAAPFGAQLPLEATLLALEKIIALGEIGHISRDSIRGDSGGTHWQPAFYGDPPIPVDVEAAFVNGGDALRAIIHANAPQLTSAQIDDILINRSTILSDWDDGIGKLDIIRVGGEILDLIPDVLHLDETDTTYDIGSGGIVDAAVTAAARHSAGLHNLAARTVDSDQDFAALLRLDDTLRDASVGNVSILAPLGKDRVDIPGPSRMLGDGPNSTAFFNVLWKTVGTQNGLYDYFYGLFATTLQGGAAGDGKNGAILSIHSGLVKLALGTMRDALNGAESVSDFKTKLALNLDLQGQFGTSGTVFFGGSENGMALDDRILINRAAIKQVDVPYKDSYPYHDEFGRAFGVTDVSVALTEKLVSETSQDEQHAIEQFLDRTIINLSTGGLTSGAQTLSEWDILVTQAGGDVNLLHDALTFDSGRYKDEAHLIVGGVGSDVLGGAKVNDIIFAGDGNDTIAGGDGNDLLLGEAGDDTLQGGAGKDLLLGGIGDDTFIALPGMANPGSPNGGDDDDTYIGGADRVAPWAEWASGNHGPDETDTVAYRSGAQSPDLFKVDAGTGVRTPVEPIESRSGLIVEQLKSIDVGDGKGVEIVVRDMETNHTSGTDTLVSIERVKLSDNGDTLKVTDQSLEAEIIIDMGTSRRVQSELKPGDTLDEDAFIRNVDTVDYSGVGHGLVYFNGLTTEREQGLLTGGISQLGGIETEFGLLTGKGSVDNLRIEGADRIVLTNKDDVFIGAQYRSIVELGDGQDKVWLQPGVLVQGFDADDRLTLFGTLNLYGGWKNSASESPYAVGAYGVQYGINQDGDLLVINPWAIPLNGRDPHMFIEGWQQQVQGGEFDVGTGPGNILLAEITITSHRLMDERPKMANEIGLWGLVDLQLRMLTGACGPETADPLVLDLDGDGLELTMRTGTSARFDVDFDLYSERTAWAKPDDGILARDINGNGVIDGGGELFGYGDTYGYSILAALDGNHDGIVDAADNGLADFNGDGIVNGSDTFGSLLVWQDFNGNLISEAAELKTVGQHGIVSFTLPTAGNGAVEIGPNGEAVILDTINGNHVIGTSAFTRADGSTGTVGEVLFNIDDMNTRYDGPPIAVTTEAAALPNLKGFGTLTDLRSAIGYMQNPADPVQQQAAHDRAAAIEDLLAAFDTNDLDALVAAVRPIALIWGNVAPVRNDAGAIVTGLEDLPDLLVVRVGGQIVDYVWGGTQSTVLDTDGSTITRTTVEFASGARIVHSHDSDLSTGSAIGDWHDLYDALFGTGSAYELNPASGGYYLKGTDGGLITYQAGSVSSTPRPVVDGATGDLGLTPGTVLNWVQGEDLAFFERYIGGDLSVFYERPAPQSAPVATLIETITRMEEGYKQLAVRVAVQGGPLSSYFRDLAYDTDANVFVATNHLRQLGGTFEKIILEAGTQADPIDWLHDWKPLLDYVIGNFQRGEAFLRNTNPFLLQNVVDGYETAGSALNFVDVATAIGLPGEAIIAASGDVVGSNDIDLFYLNGDETNVSGKAGADAYVFGHNLGHVVIEDTVVLADGSGNQVRFSQHVASDFDVTRDGSNLVLTLIATGETVTIKDQFAGEWPSDLIGNAWPVSGIDQIVFADGTTWSDADLTREAASVDPGSSTVTGSNDTDYIWGGKGDDRLEGGGDFDIYRFDLGDGHDVIHDFESNPFRSMADSIYFGAGITQQNVNFSRVGNSDDYTITYGPQGDTILVEGAFPKIHPLVFNDFFTGSIEMIVFADGTSINEQQIMARLISQSSTIGDDIIYGFDNPDRIDLGKGNDWAQGANGNDIYYFGAGYGHDQIRDGASNTLAGMDDTLAFTTRFDLDDAAFERVTNSGDLTIRLPDGSDVKLLGQFSAIFPGFLADVYWDRIETFKYTDLSGHAHDFTWLDIQNLMLDRESTDGNDTIYAFHTDDVLQGGLGDDFISGGNGDDIYRYALGDGHDTIKDNNPDFLTGEFDVIEFGQGILPGGVHVLHDASAPNDIILQMADGGSIRLQGQAWHTNLNWHPDEIEEFHFANGTVWTSADLRQQYLQHAGTTGNDNILGFFSDDTLSGGAGNDDLAGADGADTYLFGYGFGHDTIRESVEAVLYSDADKVVFGAGIGTGDVSFSVGANHSDIVAKLNSTGETLTIYGQNVLTSTYTWYDVEQFVFANGTTLTKEDVNALALSAQTTAGNDTIVGWWGNDTLYGGAGNDSLDGAGGADTYLFGYGDGNDTISEQAAGAFEITDHDTIRFDDGIALSGVAISVTGATKKGIALTLTETGEVLNLPSFGDIEFFEFEDQTLTRVQLRQLLADRQVTNGNDIITGTSGNDIFTGGHGNDTLVGWAGNDTYVYSRGDGNDVFDDTTDSWYISGTDKALLHGIATSSVSVSRSGNDIVLTIAQTTPGAGDGGQITLVASGANNAQNGIETVQFDDGTIWGKDALRQMSLTTGSTDGDDVLNGTNASETFQAGLGNDTLNGGLGDDTYIYKRGDGNDIVNEANSYYYFGGNDRLILNDIDPASVTFDLTSDRDIILVVGESAPGAGNGGRISLSGTGDASWQRGIESVRFDDGTIWSNTDLKTRYLSGLSTPGNDTITGFNSSDTFQAGRGNDTLNGDTGNDTFIYNRGDGNDIVNEANGYYYSGGIDTLVLHNIDKALVTFDLTVDRDIVLVIGESVSGAGDSGRIALSGTGDASWDRGIESVRFDDGTIWSNTELKTRYLEGTGTSGNDTITGFNTADTLRGRGGNDSLDGASGDDTYIYARGDGEDTITDSSGSADRLVLTGISSSAVTVFSNGPDITILVPESAPEAGDAGSFLLKNERTAGLEQIVFSDVTWTRAQLVAAVSYYGGTSGNDTVSGTSSADDICAGLGDDLLVGQAGNDGYTYAPGNGNDTIDELATGTDVDTLILSGINQADVRFERPFSDLTDAVIRVLSTGQTIRLDNQFDQEDGVERIVFGDGSVLGGYDWSLDTALLGLVTIYGTAGNDTIYGSTTSNDTLDSGAGDDWLAGEEGSDTYIYAAGYGNDFVNEKATGTDKDILVLRGLNQADVRFERPFADLTDVIIRIKATGESFTLDNQFDQEDGVEKIFFHDGSVLGGDDWSLDTALLGLVTIYGTAGNDTIYGSTTSNDTLDSGPGDDWLAGEEGSDTYVYAGGYGNDFLNEKATGTDKDVLVLRGLNQVDMSIERPSSDMTDIVIRINATGETFTLDNQFDQEDGVEKIIFADASTIGGNDWSLDGVLANLATITGTTSGETIVGTSSADRIFGGAGADTLTGGAGSDTFIFKAGFGLDKITDFVAGAGSADVIQFADNMFDNFASILAAASQVGADTVISHDAGNVLTLKNVTLANLHQDDFQFIAA